MDPGKLGHVLRRGDCVGKEKAIVKDIGSGYITLLVGGDKPEDRQFELHPKAPQVDALPSDAPDTAATRPQAPIVEPAPPQQQQRQQPAGAGTTVIERNPPTVTPIVPPQAPTTLKP